MRLDLVMRHQAEEHLVEHPRGVRRHQLGERRHQRPIALNVFRGGDDRDIERAGDAYQPNHALDKWLAPVERQFAEE